MDEYEWRDSSFSAKQLLATHLDGFSDDRFHMVKVAIPARAVAAATYAVVSARVVDAIPSSKRCRIRASTVGLRRSDLVTIQVIVMVLGNLLHRLSETLRGAT